MKCRKHIGKERSAALEGMPLYLVILVVVAGIVMGVVVSWLSFAQKPQLTDIDVNPVDVMASGGTYTISVKAFDQKGNPLEDAHVDISGAGVVGAHAKTDSDGLAEIDVNPQATGKMTVTVEYSASMTLQETVYVY